MAPLNTFRCPDCDYKTSFRLRLANHIISSHDEKTVYKAYVPIECGKCDFTTKRVRLLLRHPCRGNKKPEENEDVTENVIEGSGDAESNVSQDESQVSQQCGSSQETQEQAGAKAETKVKVPLSKEEKVIRNAKKRERTKRKVAEIRAEAKALGYRTPALMKLRKKKKRRTMNIPFVLNFPAEETKVTTMDKFRYGFGTWN